MNVQKISMMNFTHLSLVLLFLSKHATAMMCFQCNSTSERTCGESLPQHHSLIPLSCSHIQEAQFCVKMTGVVEAAGINCYQCDSNSNDNNCPEELHRLAPSRTLQSSSCQSVFEARYCIKTTGMFEGQLGTKRFCSSRDWGNYCEWVRRPGDEREYRACVFTCQTEGCNHGHMTRASQATLLIMPLILTMRLMM